MTIVNQLLSEINYRSLETSLTGAVKATAYTEPSARAETIEYRSFVRSITFTGAESELDSYHIPNVFKGVVSNLDFESGTKYFCLASQ